MINRIDEIPTATLVEELKRRMDVCSYSVNETENLEISIDDMDGRKLYYNLVGNYETAYRIDDVYHESELTVLVIKK